MRVVDALGVVVLLVAAVLGAVALRRRQLLHRPGAMECALRRNPRPGGGGWSLGVARFTASELEWHRVLSLSPRPAFVLGRIGAEVLHRRTALPVEHMASTVGGCVLALDLLPHHHQVEVAVAPAVLTALVAWLEAAPPGMPRSLAG